jgi:hypothetical protein
MLHKFLEDYLKRIELALLALNQVYVERYTEEILTPNRVNLRLRIRWYSGYLLEINEAVIVENNVLTFLDYRYHCPDQQNSLIFRYDSTPHFPNLSSFPHHKHLPEDVLACEKPELVQVLQEVSILI